jgi:class 3 adenylate cyclase
MSAVVFTDAPLKIRRLPFFSGRGAEDVETRPLKDLKKALPSLEMTPIVYLDVQGCSEAEQGRLLTLVGANPRARFCILDPTAKITDVAAVLHAGAVDYLGKTLLSQPPGARVNARRKSALLGYTRRIGKGLSEEAPAVLEPASASGDGWKEIEVGREHAFAFLFVEVDDAEEMKLRHEPQNLSAALGSFRDFVDRLVSQHGGRLWMWSNFGGLALFPLHERSPQAPVCGLRILLSSVFYDCEESILPGRLSFRMALSVGSTVYNPRETGKIISDAVNSIFHLGRRFAHPAQFVLAGEAFELLPQQLRALFKPAGSFEGQRVHRMLRPVTAAGTPLVGLAEPAARRESVRRAQAGAR